MRSFGFLMLFAALPIVALAQGDPSQGRMNARVTEMEKAKDSASNGENDRKFAKDALTMGLTESEIGKFVAQNASSNAVKQFAEKASTDKQKANPKLREIAASYQIPVPEGPKRSARLDKLSKLSGEELDRAYVKDELKERQHSERDFYMESLNGVNPDVKDFAAKNLPVLYDQIEQLKSLEKGK